MPDVAGWHLAEFNIARLRAPIGDPEVQGFVDGLGPINALADRSPGFVWRLQDETGTATSILPYDDELLIINLSVWESPEALFDYAYRSGHGTWFKRRREWFDKRDGVRLCMWWVPAGSLPTVDDGVARLDHLERHGPTPWSFTFASRFEASVDAAPLGGDVVLAHEVGDA